jgi:pimeloyl-ACP methyl ester carboxylesterase
MCFSGKAVAIRVAYRWCFCTAAPAAAACRITGAFSIRDTGESCCSISAARVARRPVANTTDNTTQHLVADMERLRAHLHLERWLLFGGSWGSTLALAYAESHPQRCLGLVLRGIFLARQASSIGSCMEWARSFPRHGRRLPVFLPQGERSDLLGNYYRRLNNANPAVHLPAARAWDRYESACSTLLPAREGGSTFDTDMASLAIARIEAHYFIHRAFLDDNQLLRDLPRIRHLPCTIVQGRYDIVCPPETCGYVGARLAASRVRGDSRCGSLGSRAGNHPRVGCGRRANAKQDRQITPATVKSATAAPSGYGSPRRSRLCHHRSTGRRRAGNRND